MSQARKFNYKPLTADDLAFIIANAKDFTQKELSDRFSISMHYVKQMGGNHGLTFKKPDKKKYELRNRVQKRNVGDRYTRPKETPAPAFQRHKGEYSNHSPMGIADELR